MERAHHLVACLLDEAFRPNFSDPTGRNYDAEIDALVGERSAQQKAEKDKEAAALHTQKVEKLKQREKEAGEATEREMRSAGIPLDAPQFSGRSQKRAKDYFSSPTKRQYPKMGEYTVGKVTQPPMPPAKPTVPSMQIKGTQKYQPKHRTMPKPWKNWR